MSFLTSDELKTHLYTEQVAAISRDDNTLVTAAIDGAVAEAKGYLSAFDTTSIFAATGSNRNQLLLIFVKDIAVWHFINLANPATNYDARKNRYEQAIAWLKGVQKGNISPDLPASSDTDKPGTIIYGSNTKRENHF